VNPTRNDLPPETRQGLVQLLNDQLADLIDLRLQAKQAHWNVKGRNFYGLHELFDSIHEELGEHVDEVAERLVALGGIAHGTVAAVSQRTRLPLYPIEITASDDHCRAMSDALAATGRSVRAAIGQADDLGDADTADLLTAVSRDLDKRLWMVEAHLQGEK
jgi:starvation-inducible DNA-binding protein